MGGGQPWKRGKPRRNPGVPGLCSRVPRAPAPQPRPLPCLLPAGARAALVAARGSNVLLARCTSRIYGLGKASMSPGATATGSPEAARHAGRARRPPLAFERTGFATAALAHVRRPASAAVRRRTPSRSIHDLADHHVNRVIHHVRTRDRDGDGEGLGLQDPETPRTSGDPA